MNPNPLSSLNHFTVPVAMLSRSSDVALCCGRSRMPLRGGPRPPGCTGPDGAQPTRCPGDIRRTAERAAARHCHHGRMTEASTGEGSAATSIDDLGGGPGFRKIGSPHPASVRSMRDTGDEDAVSIVAGGENGDVGGDGRRPEGEAERHRQTTGAPEA